MSGQVYGAGAKSAGSIDDEPGKQIEASNSSSMTGKNPFAILKASAIADPATCVFPNNFTNLPKVSPPFLNPLEHGSDEYTLVLDLDETLIHNVDSGNDSFFLVRPGCVEFIKNMAKYYEIVIFTAALQEYADQVIDQIDVDNNIRYRLYRQHTSQNGPFLVKDLSLLGREMDRTMIIDNISDNFVLQPDNGIFCSTWYDDMNDNFLDEITPLLG
jgi:Dullard-like phosphatase family protein